MLRQLLLLPAALLIVAMAVTAAAFVPLLADRGQPARPGRKELGTLARESLAKAFIWMTSPFGPRAGRPRRGGGEARPVLLVADHGHGRAAMVGLSAFLLRRGHASVLVAPTGRGSLKERAERLNQAASRLRRASGPGPIHVVGHGIGGLVAAWWLRHLADDDGVDRFVSLGTPWAGTRMSAFARGPIARETQPGSPLLDDLAPSGDRLVCIWGSLDPMVLPLQSAVVDGATSVKLSGAGHLDLLFSARAYRAVAAALHERDTEPAGPAVGARYGAPHEEPS